MNKNQQWEKAVLAEARAAKSRGDVTISIHDVEKRITAWEENRDKFKVVALDFFRWFERTKGDLHPDCTMEQVFDTYWDKHKSFFGDGI